MKIKKINNLWILLLFAALFVACAGASDNNGAGEGAAGTATINGTVAYQSPPTPGSMLYVVDVNDPDNWQVLVLPEAEGMASFSVTVEAGSYKLYAHPIEFPMSAAGYMNADFSELGTLTVAAGEIVDDAAVVFIAPQVPCQSVSVPASPEGLFPEIFGPDTDCIDAVNAAQDTTEATIEETPTQTVPDITGIRGVVEFDTNTSLPESAILYAMNTNDFRKWVSLEIPMHDVGAYQYPFTIELDPGSYVLVVWQNTDIPLGEISAERPSELNLLTIVEGEAVEDIHLGFVYPQDPCQEVAIPPSPDGRYAGIDRDAACLGEPEEDDTKSETDSDEIDLSGSGTISGAVSFQGVATSGSTKLYLVNQDTGGWYWLGWFDGSTVMSFSEEVAAGRYILFAHEVGGPAVAAHLNASGTALAQVKVEDGDDIGGINLVLTVPQTPCRYISIPPSPDGDFPAVSNTCN